MADDPNKAVPPAPMPRDKGRWRVAPAPDGRVMPEQDKPRPPHRLPWFWIVLLLALSINWAGVLMTQSGDRCSSDAQAPFP